MSAVRNEAGKVVRVNERKDGELYREWVAKTRAGKGKGGEGGEGGEGEGEAGVVDFTGEGEEEGAGGGGRKGSSAGGAAGGGKGAKGGKGDKAGGLRTAKEMAAERMRKARSQGGKKKGKRGSGEKWEGATVKLGRNGMIKRGGGLAPSRSKVLVAGKGISGFKGGKKGGARGNR